MALEMTSGAVAATGAPLPIPVGAVVAPVREEVRINSVAVGRPFVADDGVERVHINFNFTCALPFGDGYTVEGGGFIGVWTVLVDEAEAGKAEAEKMVNALVPWPGLRVSVTGWSTHIRGRLAIRVENTNDLDWGRLVPGLPRRTRTRLEAGGMDELIKRASEGGKDLAKTAALLFGKA